MDKYSKHLQKYCRLADYISAAQIYLRKNAFLENKLSFSDIKPRLLGHWGTVPGINLIYGATNIAINTFSEFNFILIVGPGHGNPAYQAGTFLDKSLSNYYPEETPYNKAGLEKVIYKFSTPYGFPSHLSPISAGAILEGGELGYSLATAYGAVMDEPDLIAVTIIGDGEAETGPLSAAWQLNRFINLKRDGAVLPVLHLNQYKISGPTIFSSFTDEEILSYFDSLHYDPILINYNKHNLYSDILQAFDKAIRQIKLQKSLAQKGNLSKPRLPVVILRTPKGMGAPAYLKGKKIEGNSESHQVIFSNLHHDEEELNLLNMWLSSYKISELINFTESGDIVLDKDIEEIIPDLYKSIGANKYARRGALQLNLPNPDKHTEDINEPGEYKKHDTMKKTGIYFKDIFELNKNNFRIFSPDESYSNHIDEIFKATSRAWQWDVQPWEKDLAKDGRVIEILSEHELFGMLQGYVLTGRYGFFITYESFAQIISSMADQYVKFIKAAKDISWRKDVPSLNIILTSLLERQDHNGFSHQNPSFIADNLDRDLDIVNVYYPADQNIMIYSLEEALRSVNSLNIIVAGKRIKNVYLQKHEAKRHVSAGASIWNDFSDDNPDIVLATAGDYVNRESIEAIKIFKGIFPNIRLRLVNFNKLDVLVEEDKHFIDFLFTPDKPILFNYHGYPSSIKKLIFGKIKYKRILINGFQELGSTTTPFDMLARNGISRFDTVKDLAALLLRFGKIDYEKYDEVLFEMNKRINEAVQYAQENAEDMPELRFDE